MELRFDHLAGVGGADLLQSRTIDFLRFPLIFLVIYIHSFGEPLTDNPDFGLQIYDNIRIFFSHIISRISVPAFYLISGYLFFYKIKEFNITIYKKKLKSRFKTIFLPYLVWNILWIGYQVFSRLIKGMLDSSFDGLGEIRQFFISNGWINSLWSCSEWPYRLSWFGWECPSSGPVLVPMWFLRDLIVAIILSYPLYMLINRFKISFLLLLLFCFLSGLWPNIPGLSVDCLFFFGLGAYLSINGKNMILVFSRYSRVILPIGLLLTILMVYYKSDFTIIGVYIYPFFLIFGVLSVFIISAWLLNKYQYFKNPSVLSKSSFFIYASHTFLILWYCTSFLQRVLPNGNITIMIIRYMLIPILTVVVCLVVYILLERFAPRILNILSGNRSIK